MRRDLAILDEMIDAAEQAHAIAIDADPATLSRDRMRRDALLWNLTVLGEGAGQISEELTRVHPGLPWRKPTALCNRIVDGYWSIDLEIIHTTAVEDLPGLASQLRKIRTALEARMDTP